MVKKGDFLAQIDPRPYQAALEQAQGTLAHDQGLLAQAKADLKRYQTLGRQDSIAQQQLEDQRYLVQQYTGTVQTDQGTVDNAKLNLAYCHIVSPIDGQVGLRQVDPGNYVQTSDTTGIVVITQMQPISVLFSVPEDNLPEIIQRLRAGATLPVEAYDRANVTQLASGQLATLDNQIDTTTGTVKLRAIFANPDELLYPEPVRQRSFAGEHGAKHRPRAGAGGAAGRARHLRLCHQRQQHRLGASGEGRADRWRLHGGASGPASRAKGGDRRHRPVARRSPGRVPPPAAAQPSRRRRPGRWRRRHGRQPARMPAAAARAHRDRRQPAAASQPRALRPTEPPAAGASQH